SSSVAGQIDMLLARQGEISGAIEADLARVDDVFRRQTGVVEERTQAMERALGTGVDNIRVALEGSAGVVAGALREKVLEVTALLGEEAERAFSDADRRIGDRTDAIAKAISERTGEMGQLLGESDRQLAERAAEISRAIVERTGEIASVLTERTGDISRVLADSDR